MKSASAFLACAAAEMDQGKGQLLKFESELRLPKVCEEGGGHRVSHRRHVIPHPSHRRCTLWMMCTACRCTMHGRLCLRLMGWVIKCRQTAHMLCMPIMLIGTLLCEVDR